MSGLCCNTWYATTTLHTLASSNVCTLRVVPDPRLALQRLREAAEKAKCELSFSSTTDINLPFITADAAGPKHLHVALTRAKLESLCAELLERTKQPCHQCMKDAGVKADDINEVTKPFETRLGHHQGPRGCSMQERVC